MNDTPASLSLELGVTQKKIRDFLRQRFGNLVENESRWRLDSEQSQLVRERFSVERPVVRIWTLEPGDAVRRRSVHAAYGGQWQSGISTPQNGRDILLFTDPAKGRRYGYDKYEGLHEDGTYSYTGEGQVGDQTFTAGNLALRESIAADKTIRLFRTRDTNATYVGAFTLADPAYWEETIPDVNGEPRNGIIFSLLPMDARVELLPAYGGELPIPAPVSEGFMATPRTWSPPDSSDIVRAAIDPAEHQERTVSRTEFKLQNEFGEWLRRQGLDPMRLPLRAGSTTIEPDFYVESRKWIVEAKRSMARGYVREAIGQVLDYAHVAEKAGLTLQPVILLPGMPEPDLVGLLSRLRINLIVRVADGFHILGESQDGH